MQNYKVSVKHNKGKDAVHVSAVSREWAVRTAFDEMHDRGYKIKNIGDVEMFDESTELWVLIPHHKTISQAFG